MKIGLMYCLYTCVMSSLEWPKEVLVSVCKIFRWSLALVLMLSVCLLNDIPLSKMTLREVSVLLNVA